MLQCSGQTDGTYSLSRADGLVARVFLGTQQPWCSQSLTPASSSRGLRICFLESRGHLCAWSREHSFGFHVFSAVIGVCVGLMSVSVLMRRKRVSRSRFVSWRKWDVSRNGRVSRGSSSFVRARSRALRSIAPRGRFGILKFGRGRDVVCPAGASRGLPRGVVANSHGGFFREENIILEARSVLYAVRHAESKYPLSDNFVLVLALCKGRLTHFTWFSVMRRIFASGFRAVCVLSLRWIPSELNCSDKGDVVSLTVIMT